MDELKNLADALIERAKRADIGIVTAEVLHGRPDVPGAGRCRGRFECSSTAAS